MQCPKLKSKQIEELRDFIRNYECSSREVRRAQAIMMINKARDLTEIMEMIGFCRSQIFAFRRKYLLLGIKGIQDQRKKKVKTLLTGKQRTEVLEILRTKSPRDFGYDWDYWTTSILGDFIRRTYNIQYKSKTSIYLIFKRAKFTYHKPGRVYHERNEQEVLEWQKTVSPRLKQALREKDTVILAEDEMNLSTQTTIQKIWLPQGEYPQIEVSNKRQNRSIYGFLNLKTGQEYAFQTHWQNMYITVKVLKKLRKIYPQEKLLIFWDGAGWHRGSKVQEFIQQDQNIEIIYFPKYAPEENPQEHVWKNGRSQVTHNRFIPNIDQITNQFLKYLNASTFPYSFLGWSPK